MLNIVLLLQLPFLYHYVSQIFFSEFTNLVYEREYPKINFITTIPLPIQSDSKTAPEVDPRPDLSRNSNSVSIVYMTCFEHNTLNPSRFHVPTYHISCKSRESDECHEAVPYLQFIYDHYNDLEGKIFFVHGHEYSWHYPSNIYLLIDQRMKSKQFKNDKFGSLTYWQVQKHIPWQVDTIFKDLFNDIFHGTSMMKFKNIQSYQFYCCASFFVDAANFRIRPRYEYKLFIDRLKNYSHHHNNPAYYCGRLLEYTWQLVLNEQTHVYFDNSE